MNSKFKKLLKLGFQSGIEQSKDKTNAILPEFSLRKTTLDSSWFLEKCKICKNYFREDDLVRLCPKCGEAFHDDKNYNLYCWELQLENGQQCICGEAIDYEKINDTQDNFRSLLSVDQSFIEGLEETWKPFGEQKVLTVLPNSSIVGLTCQICRYKIRIGDRVVKCPCSPICLTFFHSDIFRNLNCWNYYNGFLGKDYCPTSSRVYVKKVKFNQISP